MITSLGEKQQRHLAIAILVVALSLLFSATVLPIWSANSARQENIQHLQQRLYRLQHMADEGASLRPRLEQMRREKINNGHYLKGNTKTVAAAELQRLVKMITNRNHVSVASTQILPATEESDFIRIVLKVRVRGPMQGLIESFYDIESDRTFLFLDKLSLRDASRRRAQAVTAAKPIDAEFELAAYAYMPGEK
jgi:general secretion pathway protein M